MTDAAPVWTFPRGTDLATVTEGALDALRPPDLRVWILSSRGDGITVQVTEGVAPVHPGDLLYVGGRGAFETLRREVWPGERVLLTLSAWPKRTT